jgi:hypothetical protein
VQDSAPEVIATTPNAPWLPPGGVADVVLGGPVLRPMGLVRLLLTDRDRVFCIPRDGSGKPDLPSARVGPDDLDGTDDLDGAAAIAELARRVVGAPVPLRYVGAVRNTVAVGADGYEWPTPVAAFGVWTTDAAPVVSGEWLRGGAGSMLAERHWYPLLARLGAQVYRRPGLLA